MVLPWVSAAAADWNVEACIEPSIEDSDGSEHTTTSRSSMLRLAAHHQIAVLVEPVSSNGTSPRLDLAWLGLLDPDHLVAVEDAQRVERLLELFARFSIHLISTSRKEMQESLTRLMASTVSVPSSCSK